MTDDNLELGQPTRPMPHGPVDFAYLRDQTFADRDLERELLTLFVAQATRVVPSLPDLPSAAQAESAHLLKGSARAIGAFEAAALAGLYEADDAPRAATYPALAAAFAAVEEAIGVYLRRE